MDEEASDALADRLGEVLADIQRMAVEHRDDGRETVVVPASDAGVLEGTPFGLEVVTPAERFEALEDIVDAATLDRSHVYRTEADDARLVVVLLEGRLPAAADGSDAPDDLSVFVPGVVPLPAESLAARARQAGVMYTHVRPPSDESRVTFTHDDPELFF